MIPEISGNPHGKESLNPHLALRLRSFSFGMVVPEHLKKLSKSRVDTPHRTECTGHHLVVVVNLEILEQYRMWGDAGYGYGNASLNYCNPPRKGDLLASESKSISPFPLNRDFGGIRHGVDWVLGSMFPLLGGHIPVNTVSTTLLSNSAFQFRGWRQGHIKKIGWLLWLRLCRFFLDIVYSVYRGW